MSKVGWGIIAAMLVIAIFVVLLLGAGGGLPSEVRNRIDAERKSLTASEQQFKTSKDEISRTLQSDPELFRARAMNVLYPELLRKAQSQLDSAEKDIVVLETLKKHNSKKDRVQAEELLVRESSARTDADSVGSKLLTETRRWSDLKKNLPKYLQEEEQNYQVLHSLDLSTLAATVQKAETDWPQKKSDLDSRLATLKTLPTQAETVWQSTAALRQKANAHETAGLDYAALVGAIDTLATLRQNYTSGSDQLRALSNQLYDSYDKLLVDQEKRDSTYAEKIKTVRIHLTDVAAKTSTTSTDENWVDVPKNIYVANEDKLGMALEHKSAGKYDSEVDKVAQPPGFAYMAPPGQQNHYGYWENRGGSSFWTWYPQFLVMQHLLYNRHYDPPSYYEYNNYYSARQNRQTYFGRDEAQAAPKYGTFGTTTVTRYGDSKYVNSGSYRSSRYASKSGSTGTLDGAKFGRNGVSNPQPVEPSRSGQGFGSSRQSSPTYSRPSGQTFGSRPSYSRPSAPSGGRRFGRR